jgi:hypothetical protein
VSSRAFVLAGAAGLLLILSCGHAAGGVTSGVEGRVVRDGGPIRVSASPYPYANAELIVRNSSGKIVAKLTPDEDGRFRIALPPGRYELVPRPISGDFPVMRPVTVGVRRDHFTAALLWAQGFQ